MAASFQIRVDVIQGDGAIAIQFRSDIGYCTLYSTQ